MLQVHNVVRNSSAILNDAVWSKCYFQMTTVQWMCESVYSVTYHTSMNGAGIWRAAVYMGVI